MKPIPESIRTRLIAKYDTGKSLREYEKQTIEVTPEEFNELQCGSSMMSLNEQRVTAALHSKAQEWRHARWGESMGAPTHHTATFTFYDIIE